LIRNSPKSDLFCFIKYFFFGSPFLSHLFRTVNDLKWFLYWNAHFSFGYRNFAISSKSLLWPFFADFWHSHRMATFSYAIFILIDWLYFLWAQNFHCVWKRKNRPYRHKISKLLSRKFKILKVFNLSFFWHIVMSYL